MSVKGFQIDNSVVKYDYLSLDNIPTPDTTLSESGKAADAKVTGDTLRSLQMAVGTPLVASTAAGMIDTTKIYVYTGSETGYTSGNWYYYDGSSWVSGGVYNSTAFQTDTTLTVSGAAADAKKTGDEVSDLKNALNAQIPVKIPSQYAVDGKYVKHEDGVKVTATDFSATNFINIENIGRIRYSRLKVTSSTPANGMAFFSENNTSSYISGVPSAGGASEAGYEMYDVDVPTGAKYAQFSWWSESLRTTLGDFVLYDASQYYGSQQEKNKEYLESEIKDVGEKIEAFEPDFVYALDGRYVRHEDGQKASASNFSATNFVSLNGMKKIAYSRLKVTASIPANGMAFFSTNATNGYISGVPSVGGMSSAGSEMYVVDVPEGANYAQFSWWSEELRATRGDFELYDGEQYENSLSVRVATVEKAINDGVGETALVADVPQSEGVQNAILTAHQFTDIMWTPVADMPGIYRDPVTQTISYKTYKKGCRQKGIPYCSGNTYQQRVNDSISFDAFATAVKSIDSVLYTNNDYTEGGKKATYYGVACSKLVQACWGAPEFVDSQQIEMLPGIIKIASPGGFTVDDLQLGDGILNPQVHCTIVTGIFRNTKGDVIAVEVSEAVMPTCRRLTWTKGEFYEHFATYGLYRYSLIENAVYRKARYINLDDGITAPDDIPIAIKRGSYINMSTSNSYKAIVNNAKWTTLHDIVNGVDVTSAISSSEITLPKDRTGYHEIYPTDANGNRGNPSYYFVYERTSAATVSNGLVTVTYTANAPAVLIYFSPTKYEYIEEDTGSITAEIPTGETSCRILFRSEYGTFFSAEMSLT